MDPWQGGSDAVPELQGFSAGDGSEQRLQLRWSGVWVGRSASTVNSETDDTNGGGAVNRFTYLRLRARWGIRYLRDGANPKYLRRLLELSGDQEQIYTPFGSLGNSDMPIGIAGFQEDFSGLIWSDNTASYYEEIGQPYDCTQTQPISIDIDVITPPTDFDANGFEYFRHRSNRAKR